MFTDDAILICQGCGLPYAVRHFEAPHRRAHSDDYVLPLYCSPACRKAATRTVATCATCGDQRWVAKSLAPQGRRWYCCREHFGLGLSKWNVGPAHPSFRPGDGGTINSHGYKLVRWSTLPDADRPLVYKTKSGWVFEHRVIMARMLGRRIGSSEQVHHLNGVRDDNRPENLQMEVNNGSHTRLHAAVYAELRALRAENERLTQLVPA